MDNIGLINECYDQSKAMVIQMDMACLKWRFIIYTGKNKGMCTSKDPQNMKFPFASKVIEKVTCFTCPEGSLTSDNTIGSELDKRKVNA